MKKLIRLYPDMPTWKLASMFGRNERSIYQKAISLGVRKSDRFLRSKECGRLQNGSKVGEKTKFRPGHIPHNKGKMGWQSGGNSAKTRFKKGNRPQNWVPVGTTRFTKDGILQRKIADTGYPPRDWKSEHSLLWEKHNGPIPTGHIVVFRNGNCGDIFIENLESISRAENMLRNTIHNLPEQLADVCRLRGILNSRIREIEDRNEKQD